MIRNRLGLKAISLCAIAVGLFMAFGVGAAQAEKGAFWNVGGKKMPETGLLVEVGAELEKHGTLLATLGGKAIDLLCEHGELVLTELKEPLGVILGHVKFAGCTFGELKEGVLKTLTACTPSTNGESGTILTNLIKGLLKLHTGTGVKDTVVLTPENEKGEETTKFAVLHLGAEPESECGFGESLTIGGNITLEDCEGDVSFLTEKVTHLMQEHKVLHGLWVNGPTTPATIDGSANVFLSGAHKGLKWSGNPA